MPSSTYRREAYAPDDTAPSNDGTSRPGPRAFRLGAFRLGAFRLGVLGLCLTLLAGCSPNRAVESQRLLRDMAAGAGPSTLKETTEPPSRVALVYEVEGRQRRADLYRPGGTSQGTPRDGAAKAALVLVPGVTPEGKDDPRLVALANSLARVRFAVLVPDIANLRSLKVSPEDAVAIADALRHLAAVEADGPVGLVAISYAAGPAVLAALKDETDEAVGFLLLIGGYYDITAVVTFFTTGYYRESPEASWQKGEPNPFGKWAFVQSNAGVLNTPRDRDLLTSMANRKMRRLDADIDDLVAELGPEGRSVYALLTNRDPERVPALMASLPQRIVENMRGLDLKPRDLSGLEVPLLLIHGRDDPVIPFSESAALAAALPDGQADLYLVDNLAHVELGPAGVGDALTLWRAAYRLLTERDAMAEDE